jgi:hypothetical protein
MPNCFRVNGAEKFGRFEPLATGEDGQDDAVWICDLLNEGARSVRHGAARAANALRALPIITYEACGVVKNWKNVRGLRLTPELRRRVGPSVVVLIEVASGEMAACHLSPFGLMALAVRHRLRAARREAARGG